MYLEGMCYLRAATRYRDADNWILGGEALGVSLFGISIFQCESHCASTPLIACRPTAAGAAGAVVPISNFNDNTEFSFYPTPTHNCLSS